MRFGTGGILGTPRPPVGAGSAWLRVALSVPGHAWSCWGGLAPWTR